MFEFNSHNVNCMNDVTPTWVINSEPESTTDDNTEQQEERQFWSELLNQH